MLAFCGFAAQTVGERAAFEASALVGEAEISRQAEMIFHAMLEAVGVVFKAVGWVAGDLTGSRLCEFGADQRLAVLFRDAVVEGWRADITPALFTQLLALFGLGDADAASAGQAAASPAVALGAAGGAAGRAFLGADALGIARGGEADAEQTILATFAEVHAAKIAVIEHRFSFGNTDAASRSPIAVTQRRA